MADTAEALQAVIVISDGFELGDEDCQIAYTMLKNFMEVNMAFVFGIFPNGEDKIFNDILSNYVYNYSFEDAVYLFNQENGQIFTDLTDQLVLNIDPWLEVTNTNNVQVTDEIHLIVDNELLHGALLEIEYEITTYALNGIVDANITDYVGETGMVYDPDAHLLTENLTNKDIGWKETEEGVTYYFYSKEEFENKIKEGYFLEYAEYAGNYYGTPKKFIEEKLNKGIDVILEIEIQGAMQIKKLIPEALFIFIMPPTLEELKRRLVGRNTDSKEKIIERFKIAYKEINEVSKYNYVVVNDEVDNAVSKIQAIIKAEKCRVDRIEEVLLNNEEEYIHELLVDINN